MLISSSSLYYINSKNRIAGTDSDFTYQIQFPPETKYDRVCVLQANIPKSYYLIQSNESFQLTEDLNTVTITVPVGNYTRKSFASTVQGLLNTNSPHGYNYAITYPTSSSVGDTGKYTFTVTGNGIIQPIITFTGTNDINEHLGFENGANNFVANTLVSTNVINLQPETTLFIHSDISTNGRDNVLQEIFGTSQQDYSSITFQQQCLEGYSKTITTR